jgi:hypothetical protein
MMSRIQAFQLWGYPEKRHIARDGLNFDDDFSHLVVWKDTGAAWESFGLEEDTWGILSFDAPWS